MPCALSWAAPPRCRPPPAPSARRAVPERLRPRALMDEALRELEELVQGLRQPGKSWAVPTRERSMRGAERAMSEHKLNRPVRWREAHPDAYAELKRSWGVIGHSSVLMVLSLSLIGTTLTLGYLDLPGWLATVARLSTSAAAVGCGAVGLWRLIRALFRSVRALIRTRRRAAGDTQPETEPTAS
ncbi:hypothetical protein SSCG_02291 [Streptomyces clavuligerus]|nr:hypothetical protein SSCG_02291 [Streptomyces clavuligerus]